MKVSKEFVFSMSFIPYFWIETILSFTEPTANASFGSNYWVLIVNLLQNRKAPKLQLLTPEEPKKFRPLQKLLSRKKTRSGNEQKIRPKVTQNISVLQRKNETTETTRIPSQTTKG